MTTRVSVSSSGIQATHSSGSPVVSADARFIAFSSYAPNLVANDTNGAADVFVRDRVERTTTRVSVTSSGKQANNASGEDGIAISADGRYVAFHSIASNLVAGDTNTCDDALIGNRDCYDVFVRDRVARTTTLVSVVR